MEPTETHSDYHSGFWEWKGSRCGIGRGDTHGLIWYDGKQQKAHRVAYCLHHSLTMEEIEGKCVNHRCDVAHCVNPEHLYLGTHADNMRDLAMSGKAAKKLNAEKVRAIRRDVRCNKEISADYGVSVSVVRGIKNRTAWRHLDDAPMPPVE